VHPRRSQNDEQKKKENPSKRPGKKAEKHNNGGWRRGGWCLERGGKGESRESCVPSGGFLVGGRIGGGRKKEGWGDGGFLLLLKGLGFSSWKRGGV